MQDFVRRLIVSVVMIPFLACLLLFAFHPWVQYGVVFLAMLLATVSVWEYCQLAKNKGGKVMFPFLGFVAAAEVLSFYIAAKMPDYHILPIAIFFLGFLGLFALHFRDNEGAIADLAVSTFGLLYVAVPLGMMLGILYFPKGDGRILLTYLILVTKIADMGAYFGGQICGRNKLAPQISPKKTVEGAWCGLGAALLTSYVFSWFLPLTTLEWVVLGLIFGSIGQFGDLAESLLKRDANTKDSNNLPGLGGGLDMVDSLLFTAPILYLYIYL